MTIIIVGRTPASTGGVIPAGGNNSMRDIRTGGAGEWGLVSTVVGNITPTAIASANTNFQISASWNGAASIGELRQQSLPTVTGTANPGDPASLALTAIAFGSQAAGAGPAVNWQLAAIFAVDGLLSAGDLAYLREGFAQRYGIV
jgi:hypothetical protein